jgi:hypothetical protein
MANYLLLYHGGAMGETKEEQDRQMSAWDIWMKQCGDNLVDAGNPAANAATVSKNGSTEYTGSERVTGYSVIKAPDMDSAKHAASMVPLVLDGSGSVDVYETFDPMQSMGAGQ